MLMKFSDYIKFSSVTWLENRIKLISSLRTARECGVHKHHFFLHLFNLSQYIQYSTACFLSWEQKEKKDLNKLKAPPDTINRNESLRENNVRVLDLCRINVHLEHEKNSQWNAMNRVVIQKAKEKRQKKNSGSV